MTYAIDGKCHNAETATFGHECGKPAQWVGQSRGGYRSGFCAHCKEHGQEAKIFTQWTKKDAP